MQIKRLRFLSFLILFSACSHTSSERLRSNLSKWHNTDVDSLVRAWGAPSQSYPLKEGGQVLTYQNQQLSTRVYLYRQHDSFSDSFLCKINFSTDASGNKVVSSSYIGEVSACLELIPSDNP